jgi:hypothetical protein
VFDAVDYPAILRGAKGGAWKVTANLKVETSQGIAPLCAAGTKVQVLTYAVYCGAWKVTANLKVESSRGIAPLCAAGDRYKSTNTDVYCILRDSLRVYTAGARQQRAVFVRLYL